MIVAPNRVQVAGTPDQTLRSASGSLLGIPSTPHIPDEFDLDVRLSPIVFRTNVDPYAMNETFYSCDPGPTDTPCSNSTCGCGITSCYTDSNCSYGCRGQ